jgi:hypothetical protein
MCLGLIEAIASWMPWTSTPGRIEARQPLRLGLIEASPNLID